VLKAITPARFAPYRAHAGGDEAVGLDLYHHNLALSGAAYEAMAMVEVALRNAIDQELRIWNARQVDRATGCPHGADWLLDLAKLLGRLVGAHMGKARSRAQQAMRQHGRQTAPSHDDVLPHVYFGTWRYLLPDGDGGKRYLWANALNMAFPSLDGSVARLVNAVGGVYQLRNRAAHLEPVLARSQMKHQLRSMRFIMRSIEPALEDWLNDVSRVETVLAQAPDLPAK
jgi:hypothetical protein